MENNAILLVRVSSLEQDYQAQIYDLKQYANSFGYTNYKIIETKETAFADLSQKVGTSEMFQFIKDNPTYNTIILTELSRLARRQSVLHQIKEWCITNKIQILIKDLDFKLLDEQGKVTQQAEITFTLFGLFAESEVKQKLERFTRKRKELMQMGVSISGKLLFGYDRFQLENKKNTLIINEPQAEIIRTIFNWYINGLNNVNNPSIKAISVECIKLGYHPYTHSKRNVNKLLKEEGYTGQKTTNNKRKNPKFGIVANEDEYLVSQSEIKYPVIIDKELFSQVQAKLKSNITQGDKETKHITLLARLLLCPSCGRSLAANYRFIKGAAKHTYRCTSRGDTTPCKSTKSLSMNLVDSAVWSVIKKDLPALSKKINEINPDEYLVILENHLLNFIQREIQIKKEIEENVAILSSIGKLTSAGVLTLIDATGKKIGKLEKELLNIEQEKAKIEQNKLMIFDKQSDVESIINDNLKTIEASKQQLKQYINIFIQEINIVQHNTQYTVLELLIKDGTTFSMLNNPDVYSQKEDKNIEVNYIIINKIVTQQPKISYMKVSGVVDLDFHRNELIPARIPNITNWTPLNKL